MEKHQDVVEALIDRMVSEKMGADQAVATLFGEGVPDDAVEFVEYELAEGEALPPCAVCGEDALEVVTVESEDGETPGLHCGKCDTGFVPESEDESDEPKVVEAELDPDNPACPKCGSDDLDGEMIEDEGEEIAVISCNGCGASMVAADEEGS